MFSTGPDLVLQCVLTIRRPNCSYSKRDSLYLVTQQTIVGQGSAVVQRIGRIRVVNGCQWWAVG